MLKKSCLILYLLLASAVVNQQQLYATSPLPLSLSETQQIVVLPEQPKRLYMLAGQGFRSLEGTAQDYRLKLEQVLGEKLTDRVEKLALRGEKHRLSAIMDFEPVPSAKARNHNYWRFVIAESYSKRELDMLRLALRKSELQSVILLRDKPKTNN